MDYVVVLLFLTNLNCVPSCFDVVAGQEIKCLQNWIKSYDLVTRETVV